MNSVFSLLFTLCTALIIFNPVFAENYNARFITETAPIIAFTDARVIDGTGTAAKEKHTVIIQNGRITHIGPSGSVRIPKDSKQVSLQGKSLLPGWVMLHEHLFYTTFYPEFSFDFRTNRRVTQQSVSFPRLYLAAGVTSARTAGSNNPISDLGIKQAIDAGIIVGPDLDLTGPYLNGSDPEEARESIRYWASKGFTSFKGYAEISHEQLAAAIDEAHKHGAKFLADLSTPNVIDRHREAVDLGIDQLEHLVASWNIGEKGFEFLGSDDPRVQSIMQHYIDNDVIITSTLPIYELQPLPDDVMVLLTEYSRKEWLAASAEDGSLASFRTMPFLTNQFDVVNAFWRKGGKLTVGSDPARLGVIAGYSNLRAIELLVDAGIPPLEVIKIATQNGAEAMGIADDRGTIEVGKRADLIVIDGDPSETIADIHNIDIVYKKGIGYDPQALKDSVKGMIGGPG